MGVSTPTGAARLWGFRPEALSLRRSSRCGRAVRAHTPRRPLDSHSGGTWGATSAGDMEVMLGARLWGWTRAGFPVSVRPLVAV